ncbi:uncharacterized protein LOC126672425 [Mercurialis annua]|uniref:uncharacterized protein LOC126672425 n=1 Tax=Mercurialis annua TaxID=3986 RepID=UPI00215EA8B3|nr:uncharacterized protein LOC126672425 [Mercurialis annua]
MLCTRPDIANAVSLTSQYQSNPGSEHWMIVKKAEYIAASELGVVPTIKSAVPLFCDNNGAIAQGKEPWSHQKSKHIERRYHIIREIVGKIDVIIVGLLYTSYFAGSFILVP